MRVCRQDASLSAATRPLPARAGIAFESAGSSLRRLRCDPNSEGSFPAETFQRGNPQFTDSSHAGDRRRAMMTVTDRDDVRLFLQDILHRIERFELTHQLAVEDLFTT